MSKMDVTGGEAFPFATLEGLMNKLESPELLRFAKEAEIDTSLKNWWKMLTFISDFIEDAEDKQLSLRAVKSWLSELRDLVYDAEDIVDVLYTQMMRTSVSDSDVVAELSSEMKNITKGLEDLKKEVGELDLKRPTTIKSNESIKEERWFVPTIIKNTKWLGKVAFSSGHSGIFCWTCPFEGLLTGISAFGLFQWIITSAFHEAKHNFLCVNRFSHYVTRLQGILEIV
ncbi:Rx, N-terminal [Dillenia turbinata]|uniref:Rx, N-terminal n=1 Tax=Dillenia turbinata TaxID=194707 RepID=A0AAN8ZGI9_9MAGN